MASVQGTQQRAVEVHTGLTLSPPSSGQSGEWNAYFEELYREADGDAARIPWADERPNPALVAWLNREAPGLIRPGASVVVVGCGLGEDVAEISERGYDPMAFDVSPTAVGWARRRHPAQADRFVVADLLQPTACPVRRADLVVEVNTIQAIHPSLRPAAAGAIAALARPKGIILLICHGRAEDDSLPDCPPFPLTAKEVVGLFESHGWGPIRGVDDFLDDEDPPKRRLRVAFRRS